jgi:hypothetical protein
MRSDCALTELAAARQFRLALRINEDLFGEKHPATAQTLSSLSAVFVGQGKYADAERLCKRALTIQEEILGPEHSQVSRGSTSSTRLCGLSWGFLASSSYTASGTPLGRAWALPGPTFVR